MDQLISNSNKVLSSQMLVATLLKHGKGVEQDGHTFYFPLAADKLPVFIKQDPNLQVANIWRKYIDAIYYSIQAQEYDLIIVTSWDFKGIFVNNPPGFSELDGPAFLKKYYQLDETLRLSMTDRPGGGSYPLKTWRPKPRPRSYSPPALPSIRDGAAGSCWRCENSGRGGGRHKPLSMDSLTTWLVVPRG